MIRKFTVSLTTNGSGVAEGYTPFLSGYVEAIQYLKTDFADGVDFTITSEATGETIWSQSDVNAAVIKHPAAATHSTAGVAALYASGGVAVNDRIAVGRDRIKIAIAQGGDTKTGSFVFTVSDR